GIPSRSPASRTGIKHMALNVIALTLFIITLALNAGEWGAAAPVMTWAIILPLMGFLFTLAAGYFGWTLVQKHHVGVQFDSREERCLRDVSGLGKGTL
ncbi:MAG: DUF2231 domain-containing protein, partial [Syntrophobacteraceae bacterium]